MYEMPHIESGPLDGVRLEGYQEDKVLTFEIDSYKICERVYRTVRNNLESIISNKLWSPDGYFDIQYTRTNCDLTPRTVLYWKILYESKEQNVIINRIIGGGIQNPYRTPHTIKLFDELFFENYIQLDDQLDLTRNFFKMPLNLRVDNIPMCPQSAIPPLLEVEFERSSYNMGKRIELSFISKKGD